MTVASALARIREFETTAEQLRNCITEITNIPTKEREQLRSRYGIREDTLTNAAKLLEITAGDFQEDLNKCEVDCKCW